MIVIQKKKWLVSVIIPTYNRGWVVKEAIDAVLNQDYPHVELIVVDDGSTDDTSELLTTYGNRITVYRQENQGVSAARNRGIEQSSGELIAFLDSDDTWTPGKLSCQVRFFENRPDALICQTEEIWIRSGRRVNPKKIHQKLSGMIFEPSLHLCLVSPSSVMMRRQFFHRVGMFDETLPACEDYDLWLRTSARYPVYLIDAPLTVKRGGHDDQLSRQWGLDKYRILSLEKLISGANLSVSQLVAARQVMKKKIDIYINGCLKRGKTDEVERFRQIGLAHGL